MYGTRGGGSCTSLFSDWFSQRITCLIMWALQEKTTIYIYIYTTLIDRHFRYILCRIAADVAQTHSNWRTQWRATAGQYGPIRAVPDTQWPSILIDTTSARGTGTGVPNICRTPTSEPTQHASNLLSISLMVSQCQTNVSEVLLGRTRFLHMVGRLHSAVQRRPHNTMVSHWSWWWW